jgi:hypothetical protein
MLIMEKDAKTLKNSIVKPVFFVSVFCVLVFATFGLPFSEAQSSGITGMHWAGYANYQTAEISDTTTLYVDLSFQSNQPVTVGVFASATAGQNIFINPSAQGVNLDSNTPTEISMTILNNGATTRQEGAVTVLVQDELGDTIDQQSINYALVPKGVTDTNTPSPTQIPVTAGTDGQLIIEVIALLGFLAFLSVIAVVYIKRKNNKTKG